MSAYLDWKAGDKVVCITDPATVSASAKARPGAICPHSNGIYTIREIRDDTIYNGNGLVLLLAEIDNSHLTGTSLRPGEFAYVEPGFGVKNFRPVQTRKTSIAIFEAILRGARVSEDV